jgi:outer membrane immunogenic protein
MKKVLTALAALAALTAPALAADMAPRYAKAAPMPVAVASWTGCYIAGGGGYGLWNQDNTDYTTLTTPRTQLDSKYTVGGRGYFGTVGGGCDYQFALGNWNLVVGAFGDYDFASMKGDVSSPLGFGGREKLDDQWSVGGRVGVLITPQLLTYFSAGYTEAHFKSFDTFSTVFPTIGAPTGVYVPGQTYKGYFLGAGDEYALGFMPGLFWKTEYRFSDLDTRTNVARFIATNTPTGLETDSHKYVHTVRSELVYRFNWGGAVVAKY